MRKTLLVVALLAVASVAFAGEDVFDKAFSMEGISRVSVENVNGKIEAYAWDRPYLKVRAVKTASGGRSDETLRLTEIRVRKVGDEIRLETVNPRRRRLFGFLDFGWRNAHVDYEIHIPALTHDLGAATDSFKYVAPHGNHGSGIRNLAPADAAAATATVMRWAGLGVRVTGPLVLDEQTAEEAELARRHHR